MLVSNYWVTSLNSDLYFSRYSVTFIWILFSKGSKKLVGDKALVSTANLDDLSKHSCEVLQ